MICRGYWARQQVRVSITWYGRLLGLNWIMNDSLSFQAKWRWREWRDDRAEEVAAISTPVIGIWWAWLMVTLTPWQYPLLQRWLPMPDCGEGHSLWEQAGLGGILPEGSDLEHCPGLPMIVPLARNPPKQRSTPGDRPDVESPRYTVPGRWRFLPGLQEEVLPVHWYLEQRERRV